jgi:DNA repair exonuclease SbcCD ATPase subunit
MVRKPKQSMAGRAKPTKGSPKAAGPLTRIRFPVLKSISIQQYQLFPGKEQKGLSHTFIPGVTVIAGINGLGKTTLLNMILRTLTGPEEPRKFDPSRPVPKSREMSVRDPAYFARRVSDRATDATVEAEFAFGKDTARVKRRLRDLRIEGLWVNNRAVHKARGDLSAQRHLQDSIVQLSRAADQYDFFFLIYAFTFSLEEKTSLIWHPDGQYQIFRILFLDSQQSKELSELETKALSLDSAYRGERFQLNKRKEALLEAEPLPGELPKLRTEAQRLQVQLSRVDEQLENWPERLQEVLDLERNHAELLAKLYLEIEEQSRRYEGLVEAYFARAFPTLPDAVKVILGQLYSQHGCLVCGNSKPKYPQRFERLAKQGLCPFCGTDTSDHQSISLIGKVKAKEIDQSERRLAELRKSRIVLEADLIGAKEQKGTLNRERVRLSEERLRLRSELEAVRGRLPLDEEEVANALEEMDRDEKKLKERREEMLSVKAAYETVLTNTKQTVERAQQKLTERFNYYASEFLAERCTLSWVPRMDTLGEEGPKMEFPAFTVQMTTAFSQSVGIPRNDDDDVSESQKEFIDLAFRMALFDIATVSGQPAMLIIETPEASLDLVFVRQAGKLLRKFAVGDSKRANVVIATTNLNRENMLRSLLGLDDKPSQKTKREAPKRVVNLLDEAAPNAALRAFGDQYRGELAKELKTS